MQQRYTLTPPQKAAAVLIAMGKPRAKQLLKYFKSDELRRMIDAGHTLKALSQTDVDALVGEFEQAFVEGSGLIDTRDAIDAIMANRHLIAHGKDSGISLVRVEQYLKKSIEVVEFIETQCGLTN